MNIRSIFAAILGLSLIFAPASFVFAETPNDAQNPPGGIAPTPAASEYSPTPAMLKQYNFPDPLGDATVPVIVNRIITAALGLVGGLFFLMFLWGGFQWMTAQGEPKAVQAAQQILSNALIGLLIVAASYPIVTFIAKAIGKAQSGG